MEKLCFLWTEVAHRERLESLGVEDETGLADRIRDGDLDADDVVEAVAETVVDRLRVANPDWLV